MSNSAPEQVESEVTSVLENVFSQLEGLDRIYSVSGYDNGKIELRFEKDVDLASKKLQVYTILRQLHDQLVDKIGFPEVSYGTREDDFNDPILIYKLTGNVPVNQLQTIAEDQVKPALAEIKGVDRIMVSGSEPLQLSIYFDPKKMAMYDLSRHEIVSILLTKNKRTTLGYVAHNDQTKLDVVLSASVLNYQEIDRTIIAEREGKLIRLNEIADVKIEEQEAKSYFRVNGLNTVNISVYPKQDLNKIDLANELFTSVNNLTNQLPQGIILEKDFDSTEFLREELSKIYKRASLSLTVLILFIFISKRNVRYLVVLLSGILVNLSLTILACWLLNIDVHLYTIAGLTIAFGLLVDNSIIMVDHLYRTGNRRVFNALLGASITTIAALALVFFLPESDRQNLIEFSEIIALSILFSLFVALFFTPAIHSLIDTANSKTSITKISRKRLKLFNFYSRTIYLLSKYRKIAVVLLVCSFGLPIFLLPNQWEGQPLYNSLIGSKFYQEQVRPISDRVLGGALRLFVRDVYEKSGYRTPERTKLFVNASLPEGNTVHQMNDLMVQLENYLNNTIGIDQYITQVINGQFATISISFVESVENGSFPYQLKSKLISRSLDWGGVNWNIYGVGRGFSNSNDEGLPTFRVLLKGYNYENLEKQAGRFAEKLLAHKRIQEVNVNERLSYSEKASEEFVFTFESDNMGSLQLIGDGYEGLRSSTKQINPTMHLNIDNKITPVVLESTVAERFSKYNLENSILYSDNRGRIDMSKLGTLKVQPTTNAIHKQDRQYLRVIGFEYFGSYKFGNDYLDEVLQEMEKELPVGFSTEKLGFDWSWSKVKRQYGLLVILVISVYVICLILFENFYQPLVIVASIPISFIGLFLTFSLFDFYFDQGGYAAFVLLGGLVVNAAIFIIDEFNSYKTGNSNRNLIKALTTKAQPILLTIFSTCLGLIPFLIDGQNEVFWFSLAVGTIGGLLFSMLAVFIFLPMFLWNKRR